MKSANDKTSFLRDLGRLLAKYGPQPFEDLANLLASPESRDRVVAMLSGLAAAAPRTSREPTRGKRVTPSQKIQGLIDQSELADPERASLLRQAQGYLAGMPKAHLLDLVGRLRLSVNETAGPSVIVSRIIEHLYSLDTSIIREHVGMYADLVPRSGGELGAWNEIIMGSRSRPSRSRGMGSE